MREITRPTLAFEQEAWASGARWVAGVDEVGVGPLAGPVTAAAVALTAADAYAWFGAVNDSKLLEAAERERLAAEIRDSVPASVGWASVEEIERIGILPARRLAMLRALEGLTVRPGGVISDALKLPVAGLVPLVRADSQCVSVAAASIVAKVARDALMVELCERFSGYGFCHNKGYPTQAHFRALERRGASAIHRRTYAPVARVCPPW